jgi:hypothetical protein
LELRALFIQSSYSILSVIFGSLKKFIHHVVCIFLVCEGSSNFLPNDTTLSILDNPLLINFLSEFFLAKLTNVVLERNPSLAVVLNVLREASAMALFLVNLSWLVVFEIRNLGHVLSF